MRNRVANIATLNQSLAAAEWPATKAYWEPPETLFWRAPAKQGIPRYAGVELEVILPGLRETIDQNTECEDSDSECTCQEVLLSSTRKVFGRWHVAAGSDNSLPEDGLEIRTAPAAGEAFLRQAQAIARALAREDAAVEESCGMHVHVDSHDWSMTDLYWLLQAWRAVQPAAMLLVPRARRHGVYCRPYYCFPALHDVVLGAEKVAMLATIYQEPSPVGYPDSRPSRSMVAALVGSYGLRGLRADYYRESRTRYNNARYRALNLHSHFYRGTIEFRLAPGSCSADEIVNWTRFYQALIAWAQQQRAVSAAVRRLHKAMDAAADHAQEHDEDVYEAVGRAARIEAARTAYHLVTEALGTRWAGTLRQFLVAHWGECAPRWFERRRVEIACGRPDTTTKG